METKNRPCVAAVNKISAEEQECLLLFGENQIFGFR